MSGRDKPDAAGHTGGAGAAGMTGDMENGVSPADEARQDESYPAISNEDEGKLFR